MKKIVLLTVSLIACICVRAQISLTMEVPLTGVIQKPQLWNALIVNTGQSAITAQLSLVLTNTNTNQTILVGTSNQFTVNNGSVQIQESNIDPVQYEYPSPGTIDQDPNGYLPVGVYEACYTLSKLDNEVFVEVAQQCIDLTVEPLSPPILNMPIDGDTLEDYYPQFTWLPPSPLNIFISPSYNLVLTEVHQGQTPEEAIQQNAPLYAGGNLTDIFLNYPASNAALDTGKLYAWQVTAMDNNQFAAQSDVWTFTVKTDTFPAPTTDGQSYVKLSLEPTSVTAFTDVLKIFYNNNAADSSINYTISSAANEDFGTEIKSGTLILRNGENFIDLPLTADDRLLDGRVYIFSVVNSRNETWSLKFLYQQSTQNGN